MKKISLLLVGVLALFSCEQEELDNFVESSGVLKGASAVKRAADLKSLMSQGILMKKLSRQLHQQIMQKKNLRV